MQAIPIEVKAKSVERARDYQPISETSSPEKSKESSSDKANFKIHPMDKQVFSKSEEKKIGSHPPLSSDRKGIVEGLHPFSSTDMNSTVEVCIGSKMGQQEVVHFSDLPEQDLELKPPSAQSLPPGNKNAVHFDTARQFLTTPVKRGCVVQMTVKRHCAMLGLSHPQYDLCLSSKVLCSALKQGMTSTDFAIYLKTQSSEHSREDYLGRVISNLMGLDFTIYDDGYTKQEVGLDKRERRVMGQVHYEMKLHVNIKARVITAYIPNPESQVTVAMLEGNDLKKMYEGHQRNNFIKLQNKEPKWDANRKLYVLDFGTRVKGASAKNFIFIDSDLPEDQPNVMLFGKLTENEFSLDVSYPLTPLQAFSMAVTSFAFKIGCQ